MQGIDPAESRGLIAKLRAVFKKLSAGFLDSSRLSGGGYLQQWKRYHPRLETLPRWRLFQMVGREFTKSTPGKHLEANYAQKLFTIMANDRTVSISLVICCSNKPRTGVSWHVGWPRHRFVGCRCHGSYHLNYAQPDRASAAGLLSVGGAPVAGASRFSSGFWLSAASAASI